uniref:Malectin domain-containing protein n=1 Tax=Salix viminalis TaxID=40686 RepID=A0A6N2KFJ5_SALVM
MESILHLLFLLFLPLLSSSESYNPQVKYFINCGSASCRSCRSSDFVGDKNSNPSFAYQLYHTARIYTKIFRYMLTITQTGSYLVRLHFFHLASKSHLADALFNVVRNSSTEFPVIKEFFLTIDEGNFDIYFIPADETHFFIDDPIAIPPLRTKDGALRTLYRIMLEVHKLPIPFGGIGYRMMII